MKFSRIILIISIVAILAIGINASFGASSENLETYKGSFSSSYDKKISTVNHIFKFNNNNSKQYFKVNIKKNYQNKYKIKYISAKYSVYDNKTNTFKNSLYKKYDGKNKNSLIINDLSDEYNSLDKLTIYYSKGKIKHESINTYYNTNLKITGYLNGKKSSSKIVQKGYFKAKKLGNIPIFTYQNIKILTKSKKHKIKLVKLSLIDFEKNKVSYKKFKGYGKNSLKIQLYSNNFVGNIKVYYY